MKTSEPSPSQARLKLTILNKHAEAKNSYELYSEMKNLGLPDEVIEILSRISKVTSKVAGKIISIGKIIVIKLLEYVAKHPLQVVGLAVGLSATYALGVALHGIFALVPALAKWKIIGGLLSKLALLTANLCQTIFMPIRLLAPVAGIVAGEISDTKYPEVSESLQQIAKDFFEFFAQLINAIKNELGFDEPDQVFA
jgi:hypothetical protein